MPLVTLNVPEETIRAELLKGRSCAEVAQEWQEPMANVLAVYRLMRDRNEIAASNQTGAPRPVPSTQTHPQSRPSQPSPPRHEVSADVKERIAGATELLHRADDIDDKRIQAALGRARKAMTHLAGLVHRYESQSAARIHIARLEAQLREARAALRDSRPTTATRSSSSSAGQPAHNRNATGGECTVGCGRSFTRADNQRRHEAKCSGASE